MSGGYRGDVENQMSQPTIRRLYRPAWSAKLDQQQQEGLLHRPNDGAGF